MKGEIIYLFIYLLDQKHTGGLRDPFTCVYSTLDKDSSLARGCVRDLRLMKSNEININVAFYIRCCIL